MLNSLIRKKSAYNSARFAVSTTRRRRFLDLGYSLRPLQVEANEENKAFGIAGTSLRSFDLFTV